MVTNTVSQTIIRWQSYNVGIGTVISDGVTIRPDNLYPIEIFYTRQDATTYEPHTSQTNLIYSGNIYLHYNYEVCDVCSFVRDKLSYNLFPSNATILNNYSISGVSGVYESPLFTGIKSQWNENNIFYIYITNNATETSLEIILTLFPSYEPDTDPVLNTNLSDPILPIVSPVQMIPITRTTTYTSGQFGMHYLYLYKSDGSQQTIVRNGSTLTSVTGCINTFYNLRELVPQDQIYTRMNLTFFSGGYTRSIPATFDYCLQYVLYYRNLKGGWDWLPIRGSVQKSYKFKPSSYTNDYLLGTRKYYNLQTATGVIQIESDVNNLANDIVYQNDLTTSLKINLGWFTDEQSAKLINLFSSPYVFIHDLSKQNILPIIITSKSLDEKKYKDNKALNKYTINADFNYKYII